VRLFPTRSPRQSSANAAVGGLKPPPAGRLRRAYLHHPHSTDSGRSTYIEPPSSLGTHRQASFSQLRGHLCYRTQQSLRNRRGGSRLRDRGGRGARHETAQPLLAQQEVSDPVTQGSPARRPGFATSALCRGPVSRRRSGCRRRPRDRLPAPGARRSRAPELGADRWDSAGRRNGC
jgi:hypothetical protein